MQVRSTGLEMRVVYQKHVDVHTWLHDWRRATGLAAWIQSLQFYQSAFKISLKNMFNAK